MADEDYDKASEIKGEVDVLRAEIEEKVRHKAHCTVLSVQLFIVPVCEEDKITAQHTAAAVCMRSISQRIKCCSCTNICTLRAVIVHSDISNTHSGGDRRAVKPTNIPERYCEPTHTRGQKGNWCQ